MLKSVRNDKGFYKRLIVLMMPIMIQNGITNFINMLDNIMIGAAGTAQMTGVAITNQLIFIFNLCIFGVVSGAGIFGAQFFGSGDNDGVKYTFRFKMIFSVVISLIGIAVFFVFSDSLLGMYLKGEQGVTDPVATLNYARGYLRIMLIGLLPYSIVQCYSSTLREGASPTLPMIAGVVAVFVNLVLNYLLIFGKCGFPELGVEGAAIATVISRYVELAIVVIFTHANKIKYNYMCGVYKSIYVPGRLVVDLMIKGFPLMINETLWATGTAMVNQSYSYLSLDAMAATNISQTFWNVFSIAYMAVGAAIGIILGQLLGADKLDEARSASKKMITFSFVLAACVSVIYMICAEFIPLAYNTEPEIRHLATRLMQLTAIVMPFDALTHSSYFTLRSGGKMFITILFDSGFVWCLNVLVSFVLSRFTSISFIGLFAVMQVISIIKAVIGMILVKSGFWVKNIVLSHTEE